MRYLITTAGNEPFLTNWFDSDNHFNEYIGMTVYDLWQESYTKDGINWHLIEIDHL